MDEGALFLNLETMTVEDYLTLTVALDDDDRLVMLDVLDKYAGGRLRQAPWPVWFAALEEKCADGTIRRFKHHSFSALKHELTKSGLMVCHDGRCLVDPTVLAATSGQEMRLLVEQARKSQS